MQRVLTTVTLLGLLVATAAAFAITEHLKLIKSPLYGALVSKELSPTCGCRQGKASVRVRLRRRDHVTVTIVDRSGHHVATIASAVAVPRRRPVTFFWNGRTDAGAVAPDGKYHPWVNLAAARRTFRLPNTIVLDTTVPKVLSASIAGGVFFVGRGRGLAIRYAFSEPAHAVVYLDGRRIIRGRPSRQHAEIKWAGRLNGRSLRAGRYVLSVGALDLAGNETPASDRKSVAVVLRYIELEPRRLTVRPGARLTVRVKTRASRYTWRLGRRHGARRASVLQLRAPTARGRYRLVVAEHGHTATAIMRVRKG